MTEPTYPQLPLKFTELPPAQMLQRAQQFNLQLQTRRSVRDFSSRAVARELIEQCLLAAGSAPSGANRQPWHFAVVSNAQLKQQIREGAEHEEREFYQRRATEDWLADLAPLGTDEHKPFLQHAPYLIVIFAQKWQVDATGAKHKNYYVPESVGIATGVLITALHQSGLATLTHTPSPMKFLNRMLQRPAQEKPLMILVVGYPAERAMVPDISRKTLNQIATFHH